MGPRVIVTRSRPEAGETAARLAARGFEPVVLPLTEFRRLAAIPLPHAGSVEAIAVTSANAVRLAPPELLAMLPGKPVYAVGEHSAGSASASGLDVVHAGTGGGAALARSIAGARTRPASVLFLCGRTRSHALETGLGEAGIKVEALEIYDSRPVLHTADSISATMGWKSLSAALVHSAQAAGQLRKLATTRTYSFLFENVHYVCISERVAKALEPVSGRISVSAIPSEAAMLELLASAR